MSSLPCEDLVQAYVRWLGERISVADVEGVCEITTPFLDRHNDHLQIYVRRTAQGLLLTDDGYTLSDLAISGLDLRTERRQELLRTILAGLGVREEKGELVVETNDADFPRGKHSLLQAMLAVNDLFVAAPPRVARLFREDVERFLAAHEIRFTPQVHLVGKSGLSHRFDFVIPASRDRPERAVRAINVLDRQTAGFLIFAWSDTRDRRPPRSQLYAIVNDTDSRELRPELLEALRAYEVRPVKWSERDRHVEELAQ